MDLGALGRAPAAFAGDDFEIAGFAPGRADDQRLEDALLANRRRQIAQRLIREMASRLQRIGNKLRDRHHAEADSRATGIRRDRRACRGCRGGCRGGCSGRCRRAFRLRRCTGLVGGRGPGAGIEGLLGRRDIGAVLAEQGFKAAAELARAGFFFAHRESPVVPPSASVDAPVDISAAV